MAGATTTFCPACQTPREAGQAICGTCGRVFDMAALLAQPEAAPGGLHFAAGQELSGGRYRVLRPLSQGGMGALYLATDREAFGRTVVVKTLLTRLDAMAPDAAQESLRRFIQEARTLADLRYPTIPQIYSYFQDGPLACTVMEYIDGADLSHGLSRRDPASGARVAGSAYPLPDVLQWAIALCRTLEYLTSVQPPVVHQDIKPANLIRDANSGQLYLVDFGAARAIATAATGPGTAIFGTPGYAAPEQYRGQSGPPSDIYALAATLYHLATDDDPGDHPLSFPRMNRLGHMGHVLRDALAEDPALRPTAAALRHNIEALLLPDSSRTIAAPDGEIVQSEVDLARWCERHWERACAWLYDDLPDLVERELVNISLAAQLRGIVSRNPADKNAGLDAAIARLDPKGYGASEPLLQMSPQQLDLGSFNADLPLPSLVRIHNAGRRYARAEVVTPEWLAPGASQAQAEQRAVTVRGVASAPAMAFDLTPGQELTLSLALIRSRVGMGDYKRSAIVLRANKQLIARTSVSGTPSYSSGRSSGVNPYALIAFLGFFGLIFLCAIISSMQ